MIETTIKITKQEYNNFKKYGFDNKPFVVEREDKYIVICHGLSIFKMVTFLKTGITTAGLRKKLCLGQKHIELYCCYGAKVINNDPDTTVMNTNNTKAMVYDTKTTNAVFLALSCMFGSMFDFKTEETEDEYSITIKW